MKERDWPLPVRVVCDTPDAVIEAIEGLAEYGEAVIVEHEGRRVAAIIPMDDLALYQRLFADEEDRIDREIIDERIAEAGGIEKMRENAIPWEQIKAEWAL